MLIHPDLGCFLEVKTRTWSERDAEYKAQLIGEMLASLGAVPEDRLREDYSELS